MKDIALYNQLEKSLTEFSTYKRMPGINDEESLVCLLMQMVDSVRRVKYVITLSNKSYSSLIADPSNTAFNPLKAAIWHYKQNNVDEAFWLIFLFIHFGKHEVSGWNLIRNVYGHLESGNSWTWNKTSENPELFKRWLSENQTAIRNTGYFGNHRKYESLRADNDAGTFSVVNSYINWVKNNGISHNELFKNASNVVDGDPKMLFHYLYKSMNDVHRFGRTAKFDYLTMIGKIGFLNILPKSAYVAEATGPLRGGRLLFSGATDSKTSAKDVEIYLQELNEYLELPYGMQVLEDAICNWQKDPKKYKHFKG